MAGVVSNWSPIDGTVGGSMSFGTGFEVPEPHSTPNVLSQLHPCGSQCELSAAASAACCLYSSPRILSPSKLFLL